MSNSVDGLFAGAPGEWIDALPKYQRDHISRLLATNSPPEVARLWLSNSGPSDTAPFGGVKVAANRFYENFLSELQQLLCGTEKYKAERQQLQHAVGAGKLSIMGVVSAAIAPQIGVAAVVAIPVIAVTLSMLGNAGQKTLCQSLAEHIDQLRTAANGETSQDSSGGQS